MGLIFLVIPIALVLFVSGSFFYTLIKDWRALGPICLTKEEKILLAEAIEADNKLKKKQEVKDRSELVLNDLISYVSESDLRIKKLDNLFKAIKENRKKKSDVLAYIPQSFYRAGIPIALRLDGEEIELKKPKKKRRKS